ncbi:MAG: VWA domain-containing protein [Candidatus Fimenecus sp.]
MISMTKNFSIKKLTSIFISALIIVNIFLHVFSISAFANDDKKGSRIIVSLGDSYSSGEGVEPFYGQDQPVGEKVHDLDWLAHRSEKSWSGQLTLDGVSGKMHDHRNENWFFVATSGAETKHLQKKQKKEYDIGGEKGYEYIPRQLDVFEELGGKEAEYVTFSLGGNDADFSKIVTEAAVPHPFNPGALNDKLNSVWHEFYYGTEDEDSIRDRLYNAYHDVSNAAGSQAKIIVAGYPKLFDPKGSGVLFSAKDATLINDSVVRFNDEIEVIVNQCKSEGIKICFVSVEEAFEGHGAYSNDAYIKEVDFRNSQDLQGWVSAYSMHPNEKGVKKYAECVQAKIDSIEKDGGKSEWPLMGGSEERDVVLVLDNSGSMSGKPLEETKNASYKFIDTVLKQKASIGVVTYDSEAMRVSNFCMNEGYLTNVVGAINSGGGTNMEAGLIEAQSMLRESSAKKKIIVLMSDGNPNEGKLGDELTAFADSIKDEGIIIYTLGFFSDSYDKTYQQALMEKIATEGCHFEVDNADDLVFFFDDIASQINGQKYIYIRIACPVDVTVEYNGEILSSSEKDLNTRTNFGVLSFEENEEELETNEDVDNRVKVLRLKDGVNYNVKIEGTDRGKMNYTIGFMDENGKYSDMRKFKSIDITRRTVVDTVANNSKSTVLKVDEDGDGNYDLIYKAKANSTGEIVDYSYILYIIIGIALLIFIAVCVLIIVIKRKNKTKVKKVKVV